MLPDDEFLYYDDKSKSIDFYDMNSLNALIQEIAGKLGITVLIKTGGEE
jgi:ABC-type transporter Mla maintaining outer membrane lipid asymmetry ATPase subunit MlaF